MPGKRKKRDNPPVGNYKLVKTVDVTENDFEPIGDGLYRPKPYVYLMRVEGRATEIKASEHGDLEKMVEAMEKLAEQYKKLNEWLGPTQGSTSTQMDPQNSEENQPSFLQLIKKATREVVEEELRPLYQRVENLERELFKITSQLHVQEKEKVSQPEIASGGNVGTLTPSQQPQESIEEILGRYKLPRWHPEKLDPYSDTLHKLRKNYLEIKEKYDVEILESVIKYAREKGMHPSEYAPFLTAGLDEKWQKSRIPGIEFTEEELRFAWCAG